jgi:hypothetical protein
MVRVALMLLAIALTGCATRPTSGCTSGANPSVVEMLYFGTATPDGTVSDEQWAAFLRDEVTPRFPDGLTHWHANGQWRGADGVIVREGSHVLQLLHDADRSVDAAIAAIVASYKSRFRQEAVLRVTSSACASF